MQRNHSPLLSRIIHTKEDSRKNKAGDRLQINERLYKKDTVDEESKKLTAFIIPQGKFKFTVSPMSLKPLGIYFGMNTKSSTEGKMKENINLWTTP